MQTVIVPICKNRTGDKVMLGHTDLSLLQLSSPRAASHHLWQQQITTLVSSHNIALTFVFFT